jgi:Protein of unknown function (DUF3038)
VTSGDQLTHLGLKLLIDLLFYSQNQGAKRLWGALLDRTLQGTGSTAF